MVDLGTLEYVELREIWNNEAAGFTPWLADHLSELGKTLRIEIGTDDADTEVPVGKYSADILCRDLSDSSRIVIENQYGSSNHDHLGKLLTYASALDSDPPITSVIWITESFSDEHRSTMDWLNEITHDEIRFFGVTVQILKIEGSVPAPLFNVVASPNDWTNAVRASRSDKVSDLYRTYQQFWIALVERLPSVAPGLNPRSPMPKAYCNFYVGTSGFALHCSLSKQKNQLNVALQIKGITAKNHFSHLKRHQSAIEGEIGNTLNWRRETKGHACKISLINLNAKIILINFGVLNTKRKCE